MTQRWLLPMLAGKCEPLRAEIAARDAVVSLEAESYRPGGIKNRDLTAHGQAVYYVMLRYSLAHLDAPVNPKARGEEESAIRLLAALRDEPATIESTGLIKVYPKSIQALSFLQPLFERLLSLRTEQRRYTEEDRLDLLPGLVTDFQSLFEIIGWCATYPLASLPFSHPSAVPKPPPYVGYLGAERLERIAAALYHLHEDRIAFLHSIMAVEHFQTAAATIAPDGGQYSQLIAQLSEQLELPSETLSRDRSLPSLLGLAVVANEMHGPPPDRGTPLVA